MSIEFKIRSNMKLKRLNKHWNQYQNIMMTETDIDEEYESNVFLTNVYDINRWFIDNHWDYEEASYDTCKRVYLEIKELLEE